MSKELTVAKIKDNITGESLDNYLTSMLLDKSFGEILRISEFSNNMKALTTARMIKLAVIEHDISLISQIVKRIDGTTPKVQDRDKYANIVGNALEEVLNTPVDMQKRIYPETSGIEAMAKTILIIATMDCGKNAAKRKERQQAADLLLARTGGMRSEPVRQQLETQFIEPSWSKGALE